STNEAWWLNAEMVSRHRASSGSQRGRRRALRAGPAGRGSDLPEVDHRARNMGGLLHGGSERRVDHDTTHTRMPSGGRKGLILLQDHLKMVAPDGHGRDCFPFRRPWRAGADGAL